MDKQLIVSIIVPVYNAAQYLEKCLGSILKSSYPYYEIIVVDDMSADSSAEIAHKNGLKVIRLPNRTTPAGPAAARNYGSKSAKGDILLFIDSDIVIQEKTVERVVNDFNEMPDVAAIFGSYDDSPAEQNFFSQYNKLQHHFVHQISNSEAVTFWAGCGAIRKDIFHEIGGFDDRKYSKPCIEDIEMGYRLKKMGYRILLNKDLQVKHLKKWTFISLLRADIFNRSIPWTKLILESQQMINDLNLQMSQKLSTGLVGLIIVVFCLSFFAPKLIYLALFLLVFILIINHRLFTFYFKRKGLIFSISAFAMYLLYYFYSGTSYASLWLLYKARILLTE